MFYAMYRYLLPVAFPSYRCSTQDTGHLQQQFREAARLRRGCLMIHTHNYFLRPASAAGQPGTDIRKMLYANEAQEAWQL